MIENLESRRNSNEIIIKINQIYKLMIAHDLTITKRRKDRRHQRKPLTVDVAVELMIRLTL